MTDDPYHEKTIDYLNVIGNIGLLEQVKTIRPYLSSQDLDLRRVAYSALRYVNSEDAHRYLTEALIHEKEDSIREISAESLSETEGDQITFSTYEKVLFTEKNRAVLRFVLNNLGKMKDSYPKSLHLIDQFIGKCGGDEICRYAESLKISLGIKNG